VKIDGGSRTDNLYAPEHVLLLTKRASNMKNKSQMSAALFWVDRHGGDERLCFRSVTHIGEEGRQVQFAADVLDFLKYNIRVWMTH